MPPQSGQHAAGRLYFPGQPDVRSPARASGFPFTKTLDAPPTTTPPQLDVSPTVTAGRPFIKTFLEPSTAACPSSSPVAFAGGGLSAHADIAASFNDNPWSPGGQSGLLREHRRGHQQQTKCLYRHTNNPSAFHLTPSKPRQPECIHSYAGMAETGPRKGKIARQAEGKNVARRPAIRHAPRVAALRTRPMPSSRRPPRRRNGPFGKLKRGLEDPGTEWWRAPLTKSSPRRSM